MSSLRAGVSRYLFKRAATNLYRNALPTSSLLCCKQRTERKIHESTATRQFRSSRALLKRDYYEILGIPKSSSKDEIKTKYRELAKKYHPDLNKEDKNCEKKFQEVSEAYEVLNDAGKRERYDAYGHAGVDENYQQDRGNPFGGGFGGFGGGQGGSINMEDLFEMFGGQMGGIQGHGSHVETMVRISFMEAMSGCKKDVSYEYHVREPIGNSGRNKRQQFKKVRKYKKATVDIPAGVDNGVQMQVAGLGAEGSQGYSRGDLFVRIQVEKDSYFKRDGMNLHVEVNVPLVTAVLGGTVDVRTLSGIVSMKIKPGTQPGAQLLLKNKGATSLNYTNRKGDQVVTLKVKVPTKLTSRQRELMEEFDEPPKVVPPIVQQASSHKEEVKANTNAFSDTSNSTSDSVDNSSSGSDGNGGNGFTGNILSEDEGAVKKCQSQPIS